MLRSQGKLGSLANKLLIDLYSTKYFHLNSEQLSDNELVLFFFSETERCWWGSILSIA